MLPKVLDIAKKYQCRIVSVDVEDLKSVSGQYLVFTVPTILVIHEGKEILRESRFIDFQNLERRLSRMAEE